MRGLITNRRLSWTIRVALIAVGLALIAGGAFFQGMFYANRRATVRIANDNCFIALNGLKALNDPMNRKLATILDWEMDSSGMKLAEMSLNYPSLIGRTHYNLLVKVLAYRKKFGRGPEPNPNLSPAEVDAKISQAIAYLESIHNTNQWGVPTLDDIIRRSQPQS
jgi:hypothetical protein